MYSVYILHMPEHTLIRMSPLLSFMSFDNLLLKRGFLDQFLEHFGLKGPEYYF